jgi:hypothetical protein
MSRTRFTLTHNYGQMATFDIAPNGTTATVRTWQGRKCVSLRVVKVDVARAEYRELVKQGWRPW